jgi:hypothetical protein
MLDPVPRVQHGLAGDDSAISLRFTANVLSRASCDVRTATDARARRHVWRLGRT